MNYVIKKIIVHAGKAHMDDLLSIALVSAYLSEPETVMLERRDPTPEEIADPQVAILDVGNVHNPDTLCFDHHQHGRNEEPKCALRLIAEAAGIWDKLSLLFPKAKYVNEVDCCGPMTVAKRLGISIDDFIAIYQSPVDLIALQKLEAIKKTQGIPVFIREIGDVISTALLAFERYMDDYQDTTEVVFIKGVKFLVRPFDKPDTQYLGIWRDQNHPDAAGLIAKDDRGDGLLLYRYNDDPRVDFSKLEGHPAILFAHKGGFIAKTKQINEYSYSTLVEDCIV